MIKKIILHICLSGVLILFSCKKINSSGELIFSEDFNETGEWNLWNDYSEEFETYTRIEDGVLSIKTRQDSEQCNRATYYFTEGVLASYTQFEVFILFNTLDLPKDIVLHMYFAFGGLETHVVIKKPFKNSKLLKLRIKDGKVTSNLKGALNGNLGIKVQDNDFAEDFIQISLCPDADFPGTEEMYLEIEKIKLYGK